MTQLSDTQAIILSAAAQRIERIALPLPDSLRGGAAAKVVATDAGLAAIGIEPHDADIARPSATETPPEAPHGIATPKPHN